MLNPFAYAEVADGCAARYPTDVKSAGFQSQLEAPRVSSHTDELWYNEMSVCGWQNIYIYIYEESRKTELSKLDEFILM